MSRSANPFNPRVVLAVLTVGAAAFLLFLYAIGAGWTGARETGAHAAANGLDGFSAAAALLERQGYDVSLSRSATSFDEEALLILTPTFLTDGEELWETVQSRRYTGPTLIVLPKWFSLEIPDDVEVEAEDGWVVLFEATAPQWFAEFEELEEPEAEVGESKLFKGFGRSGPLPQPEEVMAIDGIQLLPLVTDEGGRALAGYWDDGGYYPVLAEAAGVVADEEGEDGSLWPVVIVAEPDLLNNYGMADRTRAALAMDLIAVTLEDYDLPIVFDLTLPGLGQSENLLTLAFTPPFLAATLCLLLAALVIGWRAFVRFGPPVAEAPALARGKTELAANGASLIERARRVHLLGAPYAALMSARLARKLGIRQRNAEEPEEAIERLLANRGAEPGAFRQALSDLRLARTPRDLLRAAGALSRIERTALK